MSAVIDFFKKAKLPLLWTGGYIFVLWAIMRILFNFEIFSCADWIRVSHAHLRGLGGFVFFLVATTCIPLYIATTAIVIRTGKPLFTVPVPKIITKIVEKLFPKQPDPETQETEQKTESTPDTRDTSLDNIPAEMHAIFLRARTRPRKIDAPICSACSITPNVYPNNNVPSEPTMPENDMPLPPDFDFDDTSSGPSMPSTPMFQDIDLGFGDTDDISDTENENPVIDYLVQNERKFDIDDNDIIITDTAAIAVHDDKDFWIMDDPIWFASGKTRESPIEALRAVATEHNVRAVLYLGATNIMNYDKKTAEWEQSGIHIVTDLSDL